MRDQRVKQLALGGLLASLVLLATWQLKVPTAIGYIHLGDGVIFLSAMLMGNFAALIAGVGSALADLLAGYPIYIAPTFIIKAVMGLLAARFALPGKHIRNLCVFAVAECVMVGGYLLFESLVYGWGTAVGSAPFNLLQGAAGVALGMVFSVYLPHLKKKI
jgi:uncharacterized membrane protein